MHQIEVLIDLTTAHLSYDQNIGIILIYFAIGWEHGLSCECDPTPSASVQSTGTVSELPSTFSDPDAGCSIVNWKDISTYPGARMFTAKSPAKIIAA